MTASTAIRLKSVSFSFYPEHRILDDVNLCIGDGERVALMGPSGSGKTTLLKVMAGLPGYRPSAGDSLAAGRFAMAFQQPLLLDHLSVRDNILLPARIRGCVQDPRDIARIMGLEELLDRYPFQLSGGQQRRVALARVLLTPQVQGLLMDEPFTGLDEPLRERILLEVEAALNAVNRTCLFATHSPFEATFLADRILFLGNSPATIVAEHVVALPRGDRLAYVDAAEFFREQTSIRKYVANFAYH